MTSRQSGWPLTLGVLGTLCGALFAVLFVSAVDLWQDVSDRTQTLEAWGDTADYGVFYPRLVGNDRAEIEAGEWGSVITQSTDLYEYLDQRGAIFVEATDFQPGMEGTPGITVDSMLVNTNFLERFPVLTEAGQPLSISDSETDWIVAVPNSKRADETEITRIIQAQRTGTDELQGAVQAEEEAFGLSVPDHLIDQEVTILWYPSGQQVFGFNTAVNPRDGGMIRDPIIEIMTPANSLATDRSNAVTGDINTSLKVKLNGTTEETLAAMRPLLQELALDDNLTTLVTPSEVMQEELQSAQRALTWMIVSVTAFLTVMLLAAVALTSVLVDRHRRVLIVQRMHGFGFLRSYRGVFGRLGVLWTAQTGLALLIGFILATMVFDPAHPEVGAPPFERFPALMLVMLAVAIIELLSAAFAALGSERRNTVKRLKEW